MIKYINLLRKFGLIPEKRKSHLMRNIPTQKWLVYSAVILSIILCFELVLAAYNSNSPTFLNGFIRRGIEYTLLNGIYLIWLMKGIQQYSSNYPAIQEDIPSFPNFFTLLKTGLIFLIVAWISYPGTTDIYLYLHYGKMALSGYNPYLVRAEDFTSQFSPFLVWFQTSTYGPVSLLLFMVAAAGSYISVGASIYILKTLFLLIHILNTYLIWNEAKRLRCRDFIAIAYLINPIILFEHVGNARIDVLICTTLILLFKFLRQGNYIGSAIITWLGILSKTLPIIWLPLLGIFLLKLRRWKSIAISGLLSGFIILLISQFLLTEPKAWLSLLNPGVAWRNAGSFHDILNAMLTFSKSFLPAIIVKKQAGIVRLFKLFTYIIYCIYYAWICYKVYFKQQYIAVNLMLNFGWATLILFLFATPWYQPWYATILLCFVALLNFSTPFFCFVALIYSVCSTIAYYIFSGAPEQVPLLIASIITVVPTTIILLFKSKLPFPEVKATRSNTSF